MEADIAELTHHLLAEVDRFEPVLLRYGVFAIMAAVAVEGFGIPAPGQTLLVAAAILSARHNTAIYPVALAAWFAAVGGSAVGYAVGRIGGRRLLRRLPFSEQRLRRMEAVCDRYGGLFVVVSRFLDGFRQLGALLVGSLGMPVVRFGIMTALGAALWVGVWGIGMYYLDRNAYAIAAVIPRLSPWSWGAMGVILAVVFLYLRGGPRKSG